MGWLLIMRGAFGLPCVVDLLWCVSILKPQKSCTGMMLAQDEDNLLCAPCLCQQVFLHRLEGSFVCYLQSCVGLPLVCCRLRHYLQQFDCLICGVKVKV